MTSPADGLPAEPTREDLRSASRTAVSLAVPLFLPAIPFAFVYGLAVRDSIIPDDLGLVASIIIFAGAAQLAMVTLLGSASIWAAGLAAVVINARHIMYSAAMAPAFKQQPRWFRFLGPLSLIDQVFALTEPRSRDHPTLFRRYYLVTSAIFTGGWMTSTIVGYFFGSFIPATWQLGYTPAVMFVGLVVMSMNRRPAVVAAVVGASVCFLTIGLPNRIGLLIGALAGVLAALVADLRLHPEAQAPS